ncbi:MAG: N-acetylmuramoyl-L-alanine amidase [Oscillospiraceae bacterium]
MKIHRSTTFLVPALLLAFTFGGGLAVMKQKTAETIAPARFLSEQVIIDPGHGGEDGGAVSPRGTVESGINLAVALKLDGVFGLYGVDSMLLRDTDSSTHDATAQTLHEKKVSDIHNRVARIEAVPNATVISIHQNMFPGAKYHGAHVFYANGLLSMPLAAAVQDALRLALNPENHRQAAPISKDVYLMNHISCRAILVECGFLSNPQEDALLQTAEYQTKLATTIAGAYLQFQNMEGERPNVTQS